MYIVLFIVILIISVCFGIVSYYSMSNDQNILIVRWFQMSGLMLGLFMAIIPTKKSVLES
jgi:hypothetical protein